MGDLPENNSTQPDLAAMVENQNPSKPPNKPSNAAGGNASGKKNSIMNGLKKSGLHEAQAGDWLRAFTRFHQVPVFKRVWLYLFMMVIYTGLIDRFMDKALVHTLAKESGAIAFSSIVLGVLLVFRTETAYESWLEGRKLWGQLLNDTRSFCFKLRALPLVPEQDRMKMGQYIISFAYALKHHLRDTTPSEELPGLERSAHIAPNLPMHVADKIFQLLNQWYKDKCFDENVLTQLVDQHLRALTDICGSCERVKNSQMAVSYRAFMRQGIVLNLVVCPWLLATEFSLLLCLPMILIGTYFLIGLELIAEEIEEPFGKDLDDIPLDSLCGDIREAVTEVLGLHRQFKYTQTVESPLPDLLKSKQ